MKVTIWHVNMKCTPISSLGPSLLWFVLLNILKMNICWLVHKTTIVSSWKRRSEKEQISSRYYKRITKHLQELVLQCDYFNQGHQGKFPAKSQWESHIGTMDFHKVNYQMKNDPCSCDRNFYNCVKKPEKNSALQRGLNPWPRDTGVTLYQLSYEATDVGSRSILGSYVPVKDNYVSEWCIWNKSYVNCGYDKFTHYRSTTKLKLRLFCCFIH